MITTEFDLGEDNLDQPSGIRGEEWSCGPGIVPDTYFIRATAEDGEGAPWVQLWAQSEAAWRWLSPEMQHRLLAGMARVWRQSCPPEVRL